MPDITKTAYKKIKKLESMYPLSEDSVEVCLDKLPRSLNLFLLIIFFTTTIPLFLNYSVLSVLENIFAGAVLSLPLICLHELSHNLVLKILNKDTPVVHLFSLKPCCIPQKPILLPIFKIDLLAPLWIIGMLGILLPVFIIAGVSEKIYLSTIFILWFQLFASAKDLYWFYKLKNIPNDRYVICDGLNAIVCKNKN